MADEETTEETTTDDESTSWERMRDLVGSVVEEKLSGWQPAGNSSQHSQETQEEETPASRTTKTQGFLSRFF